MATETIDQLVDESKRESRKLRRIVLGMSAGTVFEAYDFILFGSLAPLISRQFFAGVNETAAFIFALLVFAAGFAVRPFGALVHRSRSGGRRVRSRHRAVRLRQNDVAAADAGCPASRCR